MRSHVDGSCVQSAIEEGILFTDVGANRDRNSKVSWLERPSTADEGEPTVPEWLHTRLRKAAAATHERYGDKLCPVGVSKLGRWVSPRLAAFWEMLALPRPLLTQTHRSVDTEVRADPVHGVSGRVALWGLAYGRRRGRG